MLEEKIQAKMLAKNSTLAVAESCTGGHVAARLTKIPGASRYFLGGFIVYSLYLKKQLLGIPEDILQNVGAVSQEVAALMAERTLSLTSADVALAITGQAGPPTPQDLVPVGTIWCALATPHALKTWQLQLAGSRPSIIEQATEKLLQELLLFISEN